MYQRICFLNKSKKYDKTTTGLSIAMSISPRCPPYGYGWKWTWNTDMKFYYNLPNLATDVLWVQAFYTTKAKPSHNTCVWLAQTDNKLILEQQWPSIDLLLFDPGMVQWTKL